MPRCNLGTFILLAVLWTSWMQGLVSEINLLLLEIFLLFISFWHSQNICSTFCSSPTVLGVLILLFQSLLFSFLKFLLRYLQTQQHFAHFTSSSIKCILHFCYSVFGLSSIYFWCFCRISNSAYIAHLVYLPLFPLEPLA